MRGSSIHMQLIRYVIVGVGSNLALYLFYIGLTSSGFGHKTAMTLLYAVGILQTYYFNRAWSFRHDGRVSTSFLRYISAYALGYVFNLAMLLLLVDRWGWPHQWVQGAMIVVIAGLLFLMQRYWVFAAPDKATLS